MPKRFYVQRQHIISLVCFPSQGLKDSEFTFDLHSSTPFYINYTPFPSSSPQHYGSTSVGSSRNSNVLNRENLIQAAHCGYSMLCPYSSISRVSGVTQPRVQQKAERLFSILLECVRCPSLFCVLYVILSHSYIAYSPSKLQLCCLDFFILFLQLLLVTIAYETSTYGTNEDPNAEDILLPESPITLSIPLFQVRDDLSPETPTSLLPSQPKSVTSFTNVPPFVLDLRLKPIITHLRNPPPLRMTSLQSGLPLPNTTPFTLPGMNMLLRAGRQRRNAAVAAASIGREMRIPGSMVASPNR